MNDVLSERLSQRIAFHNIRKNNAAKMTAVTKTLGIYRGPEEKQITALPNSSFYPKESELSWLMMPLWAVCCVEVFCSLPSSRFHAPADKWQNMESLEAGWNHGKPTSSNRKALLQVKLEMSCNSLMAVKRLLYGHRSLNWGNNHPWWIMIMSHSKKGLTLNAESLRFDCFTTRDQMPQGFQ